jgi:MscS family membrane protein
LEPRRPETLLGSFGAGGHSIQPKAAMTPLLALSLVAFPALVSPTPAPTAPSPHQGTAEGATFGGPIRLERVAPDSPRAALADFLEAARARRWDAAARHLELHGECARRGPELAQRLMAVLDRWATLDLAAVSGSPQGAQGDAMPAGTDEIARIPIERQASQPVRMVRRELPEGARWVFSQATVDRIDDWYGRLDDRWLRQHLPDRLLEVGPRGLLWWQWLAFPSLAIVAWLFGRLFAWLARRALKPLAGRVKGRWDDELLERLSGPFTLFGATVALRAALPALSLSPSAEQFVAQLLRAGLLVAFFWALLRTVDLVAQLIHASPWARAHPSAIGLVPFGSRSTKVVAFTLAVITVLSELGYPVASLLAGLGIGGLAVALAAQKTVENLLGSVSITVDQPFRVGDFVRIEGVVGTVESIGLRSTRVRTADRTVVSFPNGKLADTRIESFGPRDRIVLSCTLNLEYGASASQVRAAIAAIEALLVAHPRLSKADAPLVRLGDLTASALKVEVFAAFQTTDWAEFTLARQELLLGMLEAVEKAGARFALPMQASYPASSEKAR